MPDKNGDMFKRRPRRHYVSPFDDGGRRSHTGSIVAEKTTMLARRLRYKVHHVHCVHCIREKTRMVARRLRYKNEARRTASGAPRAMSAGPGTPERGPV